MGSTPGGSERPGGFEPPHPPWQGGRLPGYIMDASVSSGGWSRTSGLHVFSVTLLPAELRRNRTRQSTAAGGNPTRLPPATAKCPCSEPAVGVEPTHPLYESGRPGHGTRALQYPREELNLHRRLRRAAPSPLDHGDVEHQSRALPEGIEPPLPPSDDGALSIGPWEHVHQWSPGESNPLHRACKAQV